MFSVNNHNQYLVILFTRGRKINHFHSCFKIRPSSFSKEHTILHCQNNKRNNTTAVRLSTNKKKPTNGQLQISMTPLLLYHIGHKTKTWYIPGVPRLVDIAAGGDFLGLCDRKSSNKYVSDFGRLWSYGHFLIPLHSLVWTALRNKLAGDVLSLVAYRLRCKHYFSHLTRPPIYKLSSFLITKLGRYLRNAGKVRWMGIRLASVYCMSQLLIRVQKPYHLHYSDCAGCWYSEQYGVSFVKEQAVEAIV